MARSFLRVFFDFEERTESLSDTERGRLLLCMLRYAKTGETPAMSGTERILWPVFKVEIDKEIAVYNTRVDNGSRGGRPPKNKTKESQTEPKKTEENRTETEINRNRQEEEQEEEQEDLYDDDEDDDNRARTREGTDGTAWYMIESGFRRSFGRAPTKTETDRLTLAAGMMGFSPEMICLACEKAAAYGARTPVRYITAILEEWQREHVQTPEEAEQYQFMADAAAGRNEYGAADTPGKMAAEREARRIRHGEATI